jgi:small subunit ribosomal protein S16
MRLTRGGTKRKPFYKIVVADITSPRDGRFIEIVGRYHPLNKQEPVVLNDERIKYWISNGVQPTKVVDDILKKKGIIA